MNTYQFITFLTTYIDIVYYEYCPDCGCENIDEAQFCRNCGLKFKETNITVAQTEENVVEVNKSPHEVKTTDAENKSIVSKLFYKTDKTTGQLRFAKAKSISIAVFVIMFLFEISIGFQTYSFAVVLIASVIFGLMFAVPLYVIGYVIGVIIDRIQNG